MYACDGIRTVNDEKKTPNITGNSMRNTNVTHTRNVAARLRTRRSTYKFNWFPW